MPIRLLDLGRNSQRKVSKVVKYAKQKAHWFNPSVAGWMSRIPGHNAESQCKLNDYRCVFSYTIDAKREKVFRHLSISVPSEDYAHPTAVKVIAMMFGFTGSDGVINDDFPEDWVVHIKKDGPIDDHCIVVGQDTGLRP
jgi:hypothetical protein